MGTIDRDFATISVLACPGAFMKVEQRATGSKSKDALTDKANLLRLYREMLLIRRFEEKTAEMYQAANIGAFHESLNVAKLWHLPIVFVCVNNLYGMGTAVSRASAITEIWKKACAYDMTGERVDGMDVLAVRRITDQLVAQAREKHEPSLLECVTYRYRGHSMSDPDTYRGKEEIKEWQTRDAILTLGEHMKKQKMLTDDELQRIDSEDTAQADEAVQFAADSPAPHPQNLYRDVYADEVAS